ncbi:MAG: FHA domain-containing protein [Muribaculaceae bacterium]|nr:FHA domain-containing protein [Muribaculaceae bacterium]
MKRLLLLSLVVLALFPVALGQGVIRDFNTNDFPNVSFKVHTTSAEKLTKDNVRVMEEGVKVPVTKIDSLTKTAVKKSNVLFLWDYRGEKGMYFTLDMLIYLFENMPKNEALKATVAVLNRNTEEKYFALTNSFTSDFQKICDQVQEVGERELKNNDSNSDILWGLMKSFELFKSVPDNEAKAIVLITTGKYDSSSRYGVQTVVKEAKMHNIFIYVVNIDDVDSSTNLGESLSEMTNGQAITSSGVIQPINNKTYSENEIITKWLNELPRRWGGTDYQITFTSHYDRAGESKQVSVEIDGERINSIYNVPGKTFGLWVKTHIVLFSILLFVFLTSLGLGIFFFIRHRRDVAAEKQEEEERLDNERKMLKTEQETLRRRIDNADSERRQKQAQKLSGEMEAKRQEQLNTINQLMMSKNIRARLLIFSMTGHQEATITRAETTIGTAEDNDIVIEDPTVSRQHAKLYYNGEAFGIKDLCSTNGLVMNGIKVEDIKMRNGDTIKLGNTVLKIYF